MENVKVDIAKAPNFFFYRRAFYTHNIALLRLNERGSKTVYTWSYVVVVYIRDLIKFLFTKNSIYIAINITTTITIMRERYYFVSHSAAKTAGQNV